MKLVAIKKEYWKACMEIDNEVLQKSRRPYVLILKLRYKGEKRNFAIPLRSNIHSGENKEFFYALPPRSTTRAGNKHGLHFKKMIPITKQNIDKYRLNSNNDFEMLIKEKITNNISTIVKSAQKYLINYENEKPLYSTDLDALISELSEEKELVLS